MLLKSLIVAVCFIGTAICDPSPVFLWGASSQAKPALQTVSQEEFAGIISPFLKDHMIVAIQEDKLSSNDFSCYNAQTTGSCYAYLQGVSPKTYYANVENPAEALRSLTSDREFNTVGKSGKLESEITCQPGKLVFINFDSVAEERGAVLESHDVAINALSEELNCPVVYLYMATPSTTTSLKKRERRATAAQQINYEFRFGANFLMFYSQFNYSNNGAASVPVELTDSQLTNTSNALYNQYGVVLSSSTQKLSFTIIFSYGYFAMINIEFDGKKFYNGSLNAPETFSFACGNLTLNAVSTATAPDSSQLFFNSLQFQANWNGQNETFVFGDSWDCTPFFTPGILMGLFVVILFLAILFTGICWMMDMHTMDRFDDPKGKTITINAGE